MTKHSNGESEPQDKDADRVAAIEARIDELSTKINSLAEGNEQWQTTTITSLKQEIADLRETLKTLPDSLSSQVTALREELTLLSQELRAAKAAQPETPAPPQVDPPETPPENAPEEDRPEAEIETPPTPPKRAKRVI
jgi:uncharacterized phage infection (PIP) family protein YhgE